MKDTVFIGVDVGGTKILASVVTDHGEVLCRHKCPTPLKVAPRKILATIIKAIQEVLRDYQENQATVHGIGIGIPGIINPHSGEVMVTPNIRLAGISLETEIEKEFKLKTAVGNDVNLGVLGEKWLGAAQEANDIIGLFMGTGLGGGIIIDGKLYTGNRGFAAELGHMIVDENGPQCTCGNRGCIEAIVGRWAIERDIKQAVKKGKKTIVSELADLNDLQIKSKILQKALKKKDPVVTEIMKNVSKTMGRACITLRHIFDPELIVFGGGVIEACEKFILPLIKDEILSDKLMPEMDNFDIVPSQLGDDAVLLGAVALIQQKLGRELKKKSLYPVIESTDFGKVVISGEVFSHDVYIRADGKIKKRDKSIARETYGSSHHIGAEELKKICKKDPEELFIGTGQNNQAVLTQDAQVFFEQKHIAVQLEATPNIISLYNDSSKRKALLIHVTC